MTIQRSVALAGGKLPKSQQCRSSRQLLPISVSRRPASQMACAPSTSSRCGNGALATGKRLGRIVEWDPFERRGVIIEQDSGQRYRIANTRAFETVLPTMLRTLEGGMVEFEVSRQPSSDRVIIRNRLTPITAESYRQTPPVDFLSPEMLRWAAPQGSTAAKSVAAAPAAASGPIRRHTAPALTDVRHDERTTRKDTPSADEELFATNVVVDVNSIPSTQVARWSGPLSAEPVCKPTKNLKDMRSSILFDAETNAYLRLTQQLGSPTAAQQVLAEQKAKHKEYAIRREVVAEGVEGVVLAWSAIHRSGLIREDNAKCSEGESDNATRSATTLATRDSDNDVDSTLCIIRNVYAFQSALPTSQSLQHRRVTFTKVSYSAQPHRFFAENIIVHGDLRYDAAVHSAEEAHAAKAREKTAALKGVRPGAFVFEDEEKGLTDEHRTHVEALTSPETGNEDPGVRVATQVSARRGEEEPVNTEKTLYGVVVRWSGGQGVIEAGDGQHFFLHSAADFEQLMDTTSQHLRGAVVQFKQHPEKPRYVSQVNILSTAATSWSEVKPLLEKTHPGSSVEEGAEGQVEKPAASSGDVAREMSSLEPEGVAWTFGTLLSWSAVEGQGIIVGDGDQGGRFVLRDPVDNVIGFSVTEKVLRKGRRVKFTPFGSTGRLACNVVLLDADVEEQALSEEELRPPEPQFSMDGNKNEAIPSPLSTSYWLNRMDKAGYDTKEVKNLQNRAWRLDEDEDTEDGTEGGKFLDSEELLKKDPWWNDPKRNVRFPNSDVTAGHLALIGPASMMNVAMKTRDPKKLDRMLKKYQSRLTEEQKEYAWAQAKEMAPKYEECIRKGRERNEEPTFYYF